MKNEIPNPESSKKIPDTQSNVTICAKAVLARADKYQSYKYEKRKSASVGLCCSGPRLEFCEGKAGRKAGGGSGSAAYLSFNFLKPFLLFEQSECNASTACLSGLTSKVS